MKLVAIVCSVVLFCALRSAFADEELATVTGSKTAVHVKRAGSKLLVHLDETAAALGWTAKTVVPQKMIALCRDGKNGLCVPLRLEGVATLAGPDGLYVDAAALAPALSFSVGQRGGTVVLRPLATGGPAGLPAPTAYNRAWGKGRGFDVGQTVPDIPLYDMTGRERRLSDFLGKQYIIYCWASW